MKILYQSRKNLFSDPGGDTIQLLKTREFIQKIGCKIEISTELTPNLAEFDMIHAFNLMRAQETYLQVLNAKKQNKKVALSTIYGPYTEYEKKARGGIFQIINNILPPFAIEYFKILARAIIKAELHQGTLQVLLKGYYKTQKKIINLVDVFLPNSESEMQRVIKDFNLKNPNYSVVPNAVDQQIFDYDKVLVDETFYRKYKDCILCVGRIEGRKNQLNLIRALKNTEYKVVLVGNYSPNHRRYYQKIKQEANKNVIFVNQISHQDLPKFYKVAKVHVLPSWIDTPGLSSIEAGIMKCNIVATKKGDPYDYFGHYAYYCEPDDLKSIKRAVDQAYQDPPNQKLMDHIINHFTWEITSQKTHQAYLKMLKTNL